MSSYVENRDYGIKNYEEFMTEYRYNICHIVEVEKAFPWLRHRGVLGQDDEQSIVRQYHTNFLRTGRMVDILITRGQKGCEALLEHIEFDYPEHFKKFTGKDARPPTTGYQPCSEKYKRTSAIILQQIVDLNRVISEGYVQEKERHRNLEHQLGELQRRIQEFQQELDMKNQQISELSQKNLEMKEQQKYLEDHWEHDKREKLQYVDECNKLRKAKDEAQEKCHQILAEKGSAARDSVEKSSVRDQARNKLHRENTLLRQELEGLKTCSVRKSKDMDDCTNDAIKKKKVPTATLR